MIKRVISSVLTTLLCVVSNFSQSKSTFGVIGTWQVTLISTENYCSGPSGIQEFPTGEPENQIWTISQNQDGYTLSTPSMIDLTGNFKDNQYYFNRFSSGTDTEPARQIVFIIDKNGKLTGKVNLAPSAKTGVCIIRYSFTAKEAV
ncbi:hypothetical protein [Hymenobacter metallilatus]|uniref:Lipocalin-like domain-containing protein n=1 Tax=Hymenobacter metallilatus TaxID=2493666 RepID=A0A3R9N2E9_9BACT|nr:hypothetical protein [Hymenobacter metallilatus]RSK37369.1 hypothetical protein EI290_01580 [Hymenobacter metallilatus]